MSDISSLEYAQEQHAACVLAIAKAREAQSYSRSYGNGNVSTTRANLETLIKDRDYWALQIQRRTATANGGIRVRGVSFL